MRTIPVPRNGIGSGYADFSISEYALNLDPGTYEIRAVLNRGLTRNEIRSEGIRFGVGDIEMDIFECQRECAQEQNWTRRASDADSFVFKWRRGDDGPASPRQRFAFRAVIPGQEIAADQVAWSIEIRRRFERYEQEPVQGSTTVRGCGSRLNDVHFADHAELPAAVALASAGPGVFTVSPHDPAGGDGSTLILPPDYDPGCDRNNAGRGGKKKPNNPYTIIATATLPGGFTLVREITQDIRDVIVQEYWDHNAYDTPNPVVAGVQLNAPEGLITPNKIPTVNDVHLTVGIPGVYDNFGGCLDEEDPQITCIGQVLSGNYHDNVDRGNPEPEPLTVGEAAEFAFQVKLRFNQLVNDMVDHLPLLTSGWRNPELHEATSGSDVIVSGHDWGTAVDMILPLGFAFESDPADPTNGAERNWCVLTAAGYIAALNEAERFGWNAIQSQVENPAAADITGDDTAFLYYLFPAIDPLDPNFPTILNTTLDDCTQNVNSSVEACVAAGGTYSNCSPGHLHVGETLWWE